MVMCSRPLLKVAVEAHGQQGREVCVDGFGHGPGFAVTL